MSTTLNVLGEPLQLCCVAPVTGFYRNGRCDTGPGDVGVHLVCAIITPEFLSFSLSRGNDLVTPNPEQDFPGLETGDRWCLCVRRWKEAFDAGCAPPVVLDATHISAFEFVTLDQLKSVAVDD